MRSPRLCATCKPLRYTRIQPIHKRITIKPLNNKQTINKTNKTGPTQFLFVSSLFPLYFLFSQNLSRQIFFTMSSSPYLFFYKNRSSSITLTCSDCVRTRFRIKSDAGNRSLRASRDSDPPLDASHKPS